MMLAVINHPQHVKNLFIDFRFREHDVSLVINEKHILSYQQ